MASNHNPAVSTLQRMNTKIEDTNAQMDDFMWDQAMGEQPDPAEFMQCIEKRMCANQAMQATVKMAEKPLKTVLNEQH